MLHAHALHAFAASHAVATVDAREVLAASASHHIALAVHGVDAIVSGPPDQRVASEASDQLVGARSAADGVAPAAAKHGVGARPSVEAIGARVSQQEIAAAAAEQSVAVLGADQEVGGGCTEVLVHAVARNR